jgi:hypothetical protein
MRHPRQIIVLVLMLICVCFIVTACKTESGSKEYTPGKGWKSLPE